MRSFFLKAAATVLFALPLVSSYAQDTVRYTGSTVVNVDYHDGRLVPVVGVHSRQIFRAGRAPFLTNSGGLGWTYNHAPMIAYWKDRFWVEYLSDSIGESVPPGRTLLLNSPDGESWSQPVIIFPEYKIPDGTKKEGHAGEAHNLFAVMHQRMGFYVSKANHLLVMGYYGICLDPHDDPNDGNGIGRVVREVLSDGTFGAVYFIRYNHGWDEKNTSYPFYKKSRNKAFVAACDEFLANPLMTQQWMEEADRNDPLITLKKGYKAFCYYHLPDGRVVGLFKNALTAISNDNGKTWPANAVRAPKFVNSNAKIWGQRLSDGSYATVYNPSEYRWPLALSASADGLNYNNLLLVNGEVPPIRFGGNYKSFGPQYVRGIEEGNGTPPDGNLWVTYSMNKEDIWVSSIPVPVKDAVSENVSDDFTKVAPGAALKYWNIYSPLLAPVELGRAKDGARSLVLKDADPFDYANAERIVPEAQRMTADFILTPAQADYGKLDIEFQDPHGAAAIRLTFDSTGTISAKAGARAKNFFRYEAGKTYRIRVTLNTDTRFYTVAINGKDVLTSLFFAPVNSISRIVFRTGDVRRLPDADTPADQDFDLPGANDLLPEAATYFIQSLHTEKQ